MLGNVVNWTEDCFVDNYRPPVPTDGSPNKSGPCTQRSVRGAAYYSTPGDVRPAVRGGRAPGSPSDARASEWPGRLLLESVPFPRVKTEPSKSGFPPEPTYKSSSTVGLLRAEPPRSGARRERLQSLRVFGRLPVTGRRGCTEAGVRKASREETAGEFAPTLVSIYGEFAGAA
jgi:hypothetical protein